VSIPSQPPKQITNQGRLSLLRVEPKKGGMLVNQRDGLEVVSSNISFVKGRTNRHRATYIPQDGRATFPVDGNFSYNKGTIAFWVKSDVWNNKMGHFFFNVRAESKTNPGDKLGFEIKKHPDSSGEDIFLIFLTNSSGYINSTELLELTNNQWRHVAASYREGERFKFYLDGQLVGLSSEVFPGVVPAIGAGTCGSNICWGWGGVGRRGADSTMEDMQMFDYELSTAEIVEILEYDEPATYYKIGNDKISP
jgi:hypothetical protein